MQSFRFSNHWGILKVVFYKHLKVYYTHFINSFRHRLPRQCSTGTFLGVAKVSKLVFFWFGSPLQFSRTQPILLLQEAEVWDDGLNTKSKNGSLLCVQNSVQDIYIYFVYTRHVTWMLWRMNKRDFFLVTRTINTLRVNLFLSCLLHLFFTPLSLISFLE